MTVAGAPSSLICSANDLRRSLKQTRPRVVPQHDHRGRARLGVLGEEIASDGRCHTEEAERVWRHLRRVDGLRSVLTRLQRMKHSAHQREVDKRATLRPPRFEVGIEDGVRRGADADQPVVPLDVAEALEQGCVNHREDRRVEANSDAEHQDHRCGEHGASAKAPKRPLGVLRHPPQRRNRSRQQHDHASLCRLDGRRVLNKGEASCHL